MQLSKIIFSLLITIYGLAPSIDAKAQEIKPKATIAEFMATHLSLFAGLNESKQNINTGNFDSKFNYLLSDNQNNVFKPGFFIGFRFDSKPENKNKFDLSISYNKITTGTNYTNFKNLIPFVQNMSRFKADDHLSFLSFNVHYKKNIFTDHNNKRKYYLIAGPSASIRLSDQSEDNQASSNYQSFILNGDFGAEIENTSNYTLFIHYKQSLNSLTKNTIKTNLNVFEVGILFKASDLF